MNARTLVMIGAVALLGIGLIMTLLDFLQPPAAEPRVQTAVAAQQIEPYTVITQDMVATGDEIRARDASERGVWPVNVVVGKMSTDLIAPGAVFTAGNAQPIERVRFVENLGLEIVTFQASVDRLVGGELRPGHIINLYGYGRAEDTNDPFTVLIEPRLWVVAVTSSGRPISDATPEVNLETGEIEVPGEANDRPGTMLTVAVPPEKAYHIIHSLGAEGLSAWVTLAANQTVASALASPSAPTAGPPTAAAIPLDLAGTATALWLLVQQTPPPPPPVTGGGGGALR
jgi:hypothetical protein